ncbi:YwqG family protein [uncultured Olleya sp.]|uniref:YwqG family protein n=1 Tax=uncultured Olleya sp. TaxID=757243 RepID=UPI00259A85B9|nr:YwqG family protein [uncultured Olleya sp.]
MISKQEHLNTLKNKFDNVKWENKEAVKKGYFEFIESGTIPAIKINEEPSKSIGLGMSKIAGTPHLPSNLEWPKYNDDPMVFLAQLNLSEIACYTIEKSLPKSGVLYFFAHYDKPVNRFGAQFNFIQPKEKYKVLYFNGENTQLQNKPFPDNIVPDYKFKEIAINFEPIFLLPYDIYNYTEFDENLSYDDGESIIQFHENQLKDLLEITQILGIPSPLQSSVALDWVLSYKTKGEPDGAFMDEDFDDEELDEEFINLLSIPLFSKIGDDVGYFGIREKDLINADFDECVFVMQGT